MRFTFTVDADSNIGKAMRHAEKMERRADEKARHMARNNDRRTKRRNQALA